jgi:hypothetical protein
MLHDKRSINNSWLLNLQELKIGSLNASFTLTLACPGQRKRLPGHASRETKEQVHGRHYSYLE